MAVLLVSGFLLIPLYTRTLSQGDFGTYIVVRSNTELLSYLLYLGVPSAMARLYFDHRRVGQHADYIGTLMLGFLAVAAVGAAVCALVGPWIWEIVAPRTPAWPYLWFCFGTAALSFAALMGTTWLRLEEAIRSFVALQIGTAVLLAVCASFALAVLGAGLSTLLSLLLLANLPAIIVVLVWLSRHFRKALPIMAVGATLSLGLPIFFSYLANFALNRINLFIMQHWVSIETVAVFGLAMQVASLVNVASMSFSKAVQPMIFRAEADDLDTILKRAAPVHIGIMTASTVLLMYYLDEILTVIAPASYHAAFSTILLLGVANLLSSFSLISDTTLVYFKKPEKSLVSALIGSGVSTLLGLVLIPVLSASGAALALICAFAAKTASSQLFAMRYVKMPALTLMILASVVVICVQAAVYWLHGLGLPFWTSVGVKSTVLIALTGIAYFAISAYRNAKTRA